MDEVVFTSNPRKTLFSAGSSEMFMDEVFIGVTLKKFSNFPKSVGKITVDDINSMWMKQIFQDTPWKKNKNFKSIFPPTLQKRIKHSTL